MIKVNFNPNTTLVLGYYPDSINYNSIPEPFIEISDEEHQAGLGKEMSVVDSVFQEYIPTPTEQLDQAKSIRISSRLAYLQSTDWQAAALIKYQRPISQGVSEKCALANSDIAAIEACATIEEVEQYSINFQ